MIVLFLVVLLAMPSIAAPESQLISTAVAQVKDDVITSRETLGSYYLEKALYSSKFDAKKIKAPSLASKSFDNLMTSVLMEWVVFLESRDFQVVAVSQKEIEQSRIKVLQRLKDFEPWKQLKLNEDEINRLLHHKLQSKRFIRFKVDSSLVPVTEAEAREYFNSNRAQFGQLPFENFKGNIIAFLERKQVDRRLKDWFDILQSKYQVQKFRRDAE